MTEQTTPKIDPAAAQALRLRLSGDLVLPDDAEWDEARQAWNLAVDQRPAAVALPETAEDVVAVVRFAREQGLRIAPQGTGHNAPPLGPLHDTVLVKTSRIRGVHIDAEAKRARVDAGVLWLEVVHAAAEHGLAALAGSSPDVGVVGYSLGGGVSWLGRKHGLATNSVLAVELVTADGRLVRADAENEPELFWALRGGGGSFGVVTALEFRLYEISEVYAGILFWPLERASEILHAWREWVEDVPDELTSVGRILRLPPIPDIPEPLRGRSFVVVQAIYIGDEDAGAELIRPLRDLGPEMDTVQTIPIAALSHLHMDPEHPVPGMADGLLLADLPADAVDALVAVTGPDSGSPLLSVEVRHVGGELARARPENGALAALDGRFMMFAVGITATPEALEVVEAGVRRVQEALRPWDSGRMYLNFAEAAQSGQRLFGADAYHRLRAVKAQYDPEDVVRSNHPIPPARPVRQARRQAAERVAS
jgi:FAD binding domain-containing protein/berberine-like enzyme